MGFTSSVFLFLFLPFCLCLFFFCHILEGKVKFASNHKFSLICLSFCSLIFYSFFKISNLLWLLLFIFIPYIAGRYIEKTSNKTTKKILTTASIALLFFILFWFKYSSPILNLTGLKTSIVAPLGISFIVFSAISYIVDIYKGSNSGNLVEASLFITFFPKIVSGPIVLWKNFAKLMSERTISASLVLKGINKIVIGFAKKVIIADTLGLFVSECIKNLHQGIDTPSAWICLILYFFQIYIDFSSYSDISIGLANIFGFEFEENFNFPYISTSITEFWRRWHISLGSWFKEYVYIPLGGNRLGKIRTLINISIVFLLTGIWHGCGVLYCLWGILHGLCRIIEKLLSKNRIYLKTPTIIKWLVTTLVVLFGWAVFMLPNFNDFSVFMSALFGFTDVNKPAITYMYFVNIKLIVTLLISTLGSYLFSLKHIRNLPNKAEDSIPWYVAKEILIFLLALLSLIFMVNSTYSPFIYFQF